MSDSFDAEFKYPCYKNLNNTVPYCEKNKFVDTILDLIEKKMLEADQYSFHLLIH